MKFKYTALGASNQKLEGVLDGESLDYAREELHKMGLSVIAINEITAEEGAKSQVTMDTKVKQQEKIGTFYFLAKDPLGKEVNGTIDSKDANYAFRRLMLEYGFEVIDLYPEGASDPANESLKQKFQEWKITMEDEGIDLSKKSISRTKGELDEGEKMSEEVISEIDQFIINTKGLLKNHSSQYSDPFLREIKKTLDNLEKVRASNNLKHITKICNNLYELIANPDAANLKEGGEKDPAYEEAISKLKGSGFVSNPFGFLEANSIQKKFLQFGKAQELMERIKSKLGINKKDAQGKAFKTKGKGSQWLSRVSRNFKGKQTVSGPKLMGIVGKFFDYISATSPILRRAKKQEMIKSFKAWKEHRKEEKANKEAEKKVMPAEKNSKTEIVKAPTKAKKDFSNFFMELDSFVGWLLFFYILYFFLVSFTIEKGVGLPQNLILKTISSPLIINISIFLVIAHLAFTLKIHFFRSNFLGSLFLFFLSFGAYTILMVNF